MDIVKSEAKTIYINHPKASYSIFCYNDKGDLFINGDWGHFAYCWRAFGNISFEAFLSTCNVDYLVSKFEINYRELTGKKIPSHRKQNLEILILEFINQLKIDVKEKSCVNEIESNL